MLKLLKDPVKNLYLILPVLFFFLVTSYCSVKSEDYIPDNLNKQKDIALQKKLSDLEDILRACQDLTIKTLLQEFSPVETSAGFYNYSGIIIHLGIARFSSADDAYGFYSGLTARPRERWTTPSGEISYKDPYFSGYSGTFVFWFHSPTNPSHYSHFYKTFGEEFLSGVKNAKKSGELSYHYNILPKENRYINSIFYIKSRNIMGLKFYDTYGATYQAGHNIAKIYIEKYLLENNAAGDYNTYKSQLIKGRKDIRPYEKVSGGPGEGFFWQENKGYHFIFRYKWIIIFISNVPEMNFAKNFLRNIFNNMQSMRDRVLEERKRKN